MSALRLISRTKLYWGLVAIFLIGVLGSPVSSKGNNIFLSYGNLLDVLRQVSITGLIATGMTAVIITGGIDLSVGSLMAICSRRLRHAADRCRATRRRSPWACRWLAMVALVVGVALVALRLHQPGEGAGAGATVGRELTARPHARRDPARRRRRVPAGAAALVPAAAGRDQVRRARACCSSRPASACCFGAINGIIIVGGRLQPFIVTLAMMVTALGIARLTAGQNNAVLPVYTGSNAVAEFDMLRSLVFGVVPMPGLFFIAAIVIYGAVLRFTPFGRYVYAIGGNEEAARLSGIDVGARQDRDLRRLRPARRHRRGALRGAVPAGQARRRRRAGARRDRRGRHRRHQPDGRARRAWPAPSAAC